MRTTAGLLIASVLSAAATADTFLYAAEDGGNTDSSLSQFDARVTWGNTFFAQPGASTITTVHLALAEAFADASRPIEILIYEDPDDAAPGFDPSRAVLVCRTTTLAVPTPDGEPHAYTVEPCPLEVVGRFFVAVSMDAFQNEQVLRQDFFEPGDSSWTFYNPVGTSQLALGDSLFVGNNIDFGTGTWVVRAVGCDALPACNLADLSQPQGVLDLNDIQAFVGAFVAGDPHSDPSADLTGDGVLDLADLQAFVLAFTAGCP